MQQSSNYLQNEHPKCAICEKWKKLNPTARTYVVGMVFTSLSLPIGLSYSSVWSEIQLFIGS
jgi:hypothetical protein